MLQTRPHLPAALACAGLLACADGLVAPDGLPDWRGEPSGPPDMSGVIVRVEGTRVARMPALQLRIGPAEASDPLDALVRVYRSTRITLARPDSSNVPAPPSVLTAGARVGIWTTGVELRSGIPQYDAVAVRVVVR